MLHRWIGSEPPLDAVVPVMAWLRALSLLGSPDAAPVAEDRFVARVEQTGFEVDYIVVPYEFLVIVKDIRPCT